MTKQDFDSKKFIKWLNKQSGYISKSEIKEEFPNFPWKNIPVGITKPYVEDSENPLKWYYPRDLQKAARGIPNGD